MGHRFAGWLLLSSGLAVTFLSMLASPLFLVISLIPAALGVLQIWSGIRIAIGKAGPTGIVYVGATVTTVLGAVLLQTSGPPSWPLVVGMFLVGTNVAAGWLLMQPATSAD